MLVSERGPRLIISNVVTERGPKKWLIKGKREALLRLIARAGLVLTQDEQARIATCKDLAALDRWFDNALAAKTTADVFS